MKRFLKGGLTALFLLLLLLGGATVYTLLQSQSNGRLINYVGIVRGASQRLVKLELAGQPSDELIGYLDDILSELAGQAGAYALPAPNDDAYQGDLAELGRLWTEIKEEIALHRAGGDSGALLALSEAYFEQANDTVFSAEAYGAKQMRLLLSVCLSMLFIMALTWAVILWANSKSLLRLEGQNRALSDLARRDTLTGLYLIDAFKEEARRLINDQPQERFAVVYTDFADFKYINDVFGYRYGDNILSKYGSILKKGLREREVAGRVSADNFVLLLRYAVKDEVAARQRQADQEINSFVHRFHDRQSLPTCCGICCLEDVNEPLSIDGFLDRANFARKTAKTSVNRNYVFYNDEIRNRLRMEKEIEGRMLEALDRREFTVYYQPKVLLSTEKIGCAEALVRWRTRDGAIIPPDRFISVFERKFMIDRLDQYVFEEVCRFLRRMLDAGRPALPVSVNVSRLQFYDQDFIERYVGIRDRYQIPPALLDIEFTESIAFDNAVLLARIVEQLKEAGFTCSIDDFGKGYSSLSLLKNLPIETLKIDSFFFDDGPDRARDMAVIQSIIELAQKLHMQTVAEGIESREQVEYLRSVGCDFVQGYVFYRPMSEQDYEALLIETQ